MWQTFLQPTTINETLQLLDEHAGRARLVAGGTDVLVELSRGIKTTATLIDISKLTDLKYVASENGIIRLGGLATHNDVLASSACRQHALPLVQACQEVGAPQIRTRATVAGNLITASPANDTIVPLMALGAELVLTSVVGERVVSISEFYTGFRRTVLQPNELLREIRFSQLRDDQRGLYIKLGLRRAQAISVIDLGFIISFEEPKTENQEPNMGDTVLGSRFSVLPVSDARITLGCVAPTIVRATSAEAFLRGKMLTPEVCAEAGRLACDDIAPISDVRGSAAYRRTTLAALVSDGLQRIAAGTHADTLPERTVLLETPDNRQPTTDELRNQEPRTESHALSAHPFTFSPFHLLTFSPLQTVAATINGQPRELPGAQCKTLLNALREDAGLTGTKEGCAEGECGACTVWLNGQAVMACLVPAAQAHNATITTIEGLAAVGDQESGVGGQEPEEMGDKETRRQGDEETRLSPQSSVLSPQSSSALHPLQAAFIEHAAVQCGYCIPGFLMAGAKLLQEIEQPTVEQVRAALSGNICRCTGYRKILDAVLAAADHQPPTTDHQNAQPSSVVSRQSSQEKSI